MSLSATSAMGLHLTVILVVLAGQLVVMRRALRPELTQVAPTYRTRHWLRVSAPLMLVSMYANFYPELNVVLLSFFLPPEEVALFNAGFRTAFLISLGIFAVDAMTMPRMSRLFAEGNHPRMQQVLSHGTLIKFAASVVAVLALGVWGRTILSIFGEEFRQGYPVLMVLALAQLLKAGFGPVTELLNVTGHQDSSLLASIASLAATIAFIAFLAPLYGIEGAAGVVLAVTAGSSLWLHGVVLRSVGVHPSIFGVARSASSPKAS